MPLFDGAENAIKSLKAEGHALYIITARPESIRTRTHSILNAIFGDNFFEGVILTDQLDEPKKYLAANMF